MNIRVTALATIGFIVSICGILTGGENMTNTDRSYVRPTAVAGTFYPESPAELAKMIATHFYQAPKPPMSENPIAIIAPHAGYIYSGAIAAQGYKILEGRSFKTVIVISPSHVIPIKGAIAFNGRAYSTPFGEIPIDNELTEKISSFSDQVALSNIGHEVTGSQSEHSLEVHLPFLQTALGKFKLVAIMMGDQDYGVSESLGRAIATAIGEREDVLIVASTDLSHFHDSKTAGSLDSVVKNHIENFDYKSLANDLSDHKTEACGGGPVIAAMIAAQSLGANDSYITGFGDSGDASGDKSNVVGYLSAILYKTASEKVYDLDSGNDVYELDSGTEDEIIPEPKFSLSDDDKKLLLTMARTSIITKLEDIELDKPNNLSDTLNFNTGAFVTIHKDKHLRGCIGTFRDDMPLYEVVMNMAREAAFDDPRFPEVEKSEIGQLEIEISVLTPMTILDDPENVVVGRDGLYMVYGMNHGVLLPQVPIEHGWDKTKFLEQTCIKAGLSADAWKDKETEIRVFQAEIFSEG